MNRPQAKTSIFVHLTESAFVMRAPNGSLNQQTVGFAGWPVNGSFVTQNIYLLTLKTIRFQQKEKVAFWTNDRWRKGFTCCFISIKNI